LLYTGGAVLILINEWKIVAMALQTISLTKLLNIPFV